MNETAFPAVILEVRSGTYEGNAWASVKARSDEICAGAILSYKVDLKKVGASAEDLLSLRDQKIKLGFGISKGANDSASLKIISITK